MPKEYLVLVGAVFGGIITLSVTVINLIFNNRKAKVEFKRNKLEEIYLLANEIFNYLDSGIESPGVTFDPRQQRKLEREFKEGFKVKKERLEMIVNFYCESLDLRMREYLESAEKYLNDYLNRNLESLETSLEEMETMRDFLIRSVYAASVKNF